MPEFIVPVFAKTGQTHSFSLTENEHFGLVSAKTGSINSGTGRIENNLKGWSGLKRRGNIRRGVKNRRSNPSFFIRVQW